MASTRCVLIAIASSEPLPIERKPAPAAAVPARFWKFGLAGFCFLVLLTAAYFVSLRRRGNPPIETAPAGRPSVAVWGFKNLSGKPEQNWLSEKDLIGMLRSLKSFRFKLVGLVKMLDGSLIAIR